MTTRRQRWLIAALFLGACGVWLFHFPYRPVELYRAVPVGARFISEHHRLSDRWRDLLDAPWLRAGLAPLGVREQGLALARESRDAARLLKLVARRHTVLACVEERLPDLEPHTAWVGASWVGGRAQWLRWGGMARILGPGARRMKFGPGRVLWSLPVAVPGVGGQQLSVSVVDGVVLACVSSDPEGVRHLVWRLEHGAPVVYPLARRLAEGGAYPAADRVWTQIGAGADGSGSGSYLETALDVQANGVTAGTARWSDASFSAGPEGRTGALAFAEALVPGRPALFARMGVGDAVAALQSHVTPGWEAAGRLLGGMTDPGGSVLVWLLWGDASGRILDMRVPTLLVGVELKTNGLNAAALATECLDAINADGKVVLIPRSSSAGDARIVLVDSAVPGIHGSLNPGEEPSIAVRDRWLLMCSNYKSLASLLTRATPIDPPSTAPWRPSREALGGAPAFAVADLGPLAEGLRNALAVYELALISGSRPDRDEVRRRVSRVRESLSRLNGDFDLALALESRGSEHFLRFRLAPRAALPGMPAERQPRTGP